MDWDSAIWKVVIDASSARYVQKSGLPPVPDMPEGLKKTIQKENRFFVQSLKAWNAVMEVLGPLITSNNRENYLAEQTVISAITVFTELAKGYHAYFYKEKAKHYHSARDALCSVAAFLALQDMEELSRKVQQEPLSAITSLIRSMEHKGKKIDGTKDA